ncbi:MAG TPA: squalene synthase HpnC [Pseudonocardiaceae bacterium]|nr:squalene synthase HpnC [Pseudonocardiaceae bacterium]
MAAISENGADDADTPARALGRQLGRKRRAENFPVALRLLPRALRTDLVAVYDVARVIDDLGDNAEGDRIALLERFRADLATIWEGPSSQHAAPRHPVLRRLVPTVAVHGLEREPFENLVRANLLDQRVHRYASYAQLRDYCVLSADPIGRIVLAVFGCSGPITVRLSDRICTALQLIEHWQDVAEDRRAGRVYLPQEDLAAFGVTDADLDAPAASPAFRQLMDFQITRARQLLDSGAPLIGLLRGWARLAVAGYLAGGYAALDALRRADGDVLAGPPRPRRRDVLRHLSRALRIRQSVPVEVG